MYLGDERAQRRRYQQRVRMLWLVILAALVVLAGRFFHLQVLEVDHFRRLSQRNALATLRLPAPRGVLVDRRGRVLATNLPAFAMQIVRNQVPRGQLDDVLRRVAALVGDVERLKLDAADLARLPGTRPFTLVDPVSLEEVAQLEARAHEMPGVSVTVTSRRYYPMGALAAHVLGYMGEVGERELTDPDKRALDYVVGDHVGRAGLEEALEPILRGRAGTKLIEVDAVGRRVRDVPPAVIETLGLGDRERSPRPGRDVRLTLDIDLQAKAESLLAGWTGAIVALDPTTGEILAMASSPTYDSNVLSGHMSRRQWRSIIDDPKRPLMNRAVQNAYPPGSVFKVVVAAAALRYRIVSPRQHFTCRGSVRLAGRLMHCWKRGGHGPVDLHDALVGSCNVYFAHIGSRLGIERIASFAHEMGLGQVTGLGLRGEKAGLVPDPAWKKRVSGAIWYPGETLNIAIGQGDLLATPLQLASLMAMVATEGKRYRPRLVGATIDPETSKEEIVEPELVRQVKIDQVATLKKALLDVTEGRGTARQARIEGVGVAGKTGTVQNVRRSRWKKDDRLMPERFRDHNWFAGFAPFDHPRIAFCIFIENGGKAGTRHKLDAARELIEFYLDRTQSGATDPNRKE